MGTSSSNAAASLGLMRSYAAHRLPSLDVINGSGVSPADRRAAAATFGPLNAVLAQRLATADLHPSPAAPAPSAAPAASTAPAAVGGGGGGGGGEGFSADENRALATYVESVVGHASDIVDKLRRLDEMWPSLVEGYVAEGLWGD